MRTDCVKEASGVAPSKVIWAVKPCSGLWRLGMRKGAAWERVARRRRAEVVGKGCMVGG